MALQCEKMKMNAKILRIRHVGIEIALRVATLMFAPGICGDNTGRLHSLLTLYTLLPLNPISILKSSATVSAKLSYENFSNSNFESDSLFCFSRD